MQTSSREAALPAGPVHQDALRSRLRAAWFGVRAGGLQLARGARNLGDRRSVRPLSSRSRGSATAGGWPVQAGFSRTPLWSAGGAPNGAEWLLTAGKVQNLRVAARRLHGLVIPQGAEFSFWRALGRPTRRRGYAAGRELREGCMVASVGGGLCQLSNALYAAALEAGMQIVERHAHSKIVPGSLAERGLDATVFWNYIDLRFRGPVDYRLEVRLSASHLEVRLRSRQALPARTPARSPLQLKAAAADTAHDCIACSQQDCIDYIAPRHHAARTAWLLDEMWPEFDRWLAANARPGDMVSLPLDGARRARPAYAWTVADRGMQVTEHALLTATRGLATRLLSAQGAVRQAALLCLDALLAQACARSLAPAVDHVVVSLNLLPHLWRSGVLAGRRVSVLLNRSPLALLHAQLDRACALHPQSPTLGDFRADAALVEAEEAALHEAAALITPHRAVAQFAAARYAAAVEQLEWLAPAPVQAAGRGGSVLFPASALGRKGAYELREACRELRLPVRVLGQASEEAAFWRGIEMRAVDRRAFWSDVACVALPAFVEHRPRLLLQAQARGLPVVCSSDCGLPAGLPGLHQVRAGVLPELIAALARAAA
ncbi:MAG: hypothetical protein JWN73_4966 [Betaproteobacteria bacterium]|nr:hypothetical protein [Betaproteobacteria bacterium]